MLVERREKLPLSVRRDHQQLWTWVLREGLGFKRKKIGRKRKRNLARAKERTSTCAVGTYG
jgi:hypothetical protein